jgi:NADPH2:quinone reductase
MVVTPFTKHMKGIDFTQEGPADVLKLVKIPVPIIRDNDLLVRVRGAGVNRADINQRLGRYGLRPDFGDSLLMGLEIAGEVVAMGANVSQFSIGQRVMGIVGGGAYAEYARIDSGMALPVPDSLNDIEAAALPEAFVTAHQALLHLGQLRPGEGVLIHGAGGGVGSCAVQLAIRAGAGQVITTSSASKCERLRQMGVEIAIDYNNQDFEQVIAEHGQGGAVDLIIDFYGGPYLERNIRTLKPGGRLIQIGTLGGVSGTLRLDLVLQRRLRIEGTVMKSVSLVEKRLMVQRFQQRWGADVAARRLLPIVDRTFTLSEAAQAHIYMEQSKNFGKIVLIP